MNRHISDRTLQLLLGGRYGERQRIRIESHLRSCARCRLQLDAYEAIEFQLNVDLPAEQPSADFTDRVMSRIRHQSLSPKAVGSNRPYRRNAELINSLIATAATYIFVASGIFDTVVRDAQQLPESLQSRAFDVLWIGMAFADRISNIADRIFN